MDDGYSSRGVNSSRANFLTPTERRSYTRTLAKLRGLPLLGIIAAEADGVLRFGSHRGSQTWYIEDRHAGCARRLDGKPWPTAQGGAKALDVRGTSGKSYKGWPVGALRAKARQTVIVCEGGPDLLAAYTMREELRGDFGIVCVFGSGLTIHEEARAHFSGKHVRFIAHADATGIEFAERNARVLANLAEQVSIANLDDLRTFTGEPANDLCDTLAFRQPWGVPNEIAELFDFTRTSPRMRIIPASPDLFCTLGSVAETVTEENGENRCEQTKTDAGDREREEKEISELHQRARDLACSARKQSRKNRWALAGEIRGFEERMGRVNLATRVAVFETWFESSQVHLDPAQSRAEHRAAFLADIRRRRVASGQADTLRTAIARARQSTAPNIPHAPDAPPTWGLLAAVCRELQRAAGDAPFFITKRRAMEIIGGKYPMDGQRALEALEDHGVIRCVKAGDPHPGGKASRYRYLIP